MIQHTKGGTRYDKHGSLEIDKERKKTVIDKEWDPWDNLETWRMTQEDWHTVGHRIVKGVATVACFVVVLWALAVWF